MQNKVQLITYVDRLGGPDIEALSQLLNEAQNTLQTGSGDSGVSKSGAVELVDGDAGASDADAVAALAGLFGGVHLLPFYHPIDGADAGFDPIDHTQIDKRLGKWSHLKQLTGKLDVMADVIVNHMSSKSPQFESFFKLGSKSPYAALFLTMHRVFPNGISPAELSKIYRPRPGSPFTAVQLQTGEEKILWTTFTPTQIDIDVEGECGQQYLLSILDRLQQNGVKMIRLDACGYAIKRAGTSSFMLPQTYTFIHELSAQARARGIEVLVEIHSYYKKQIAIAKQVDRVYDFALPPLVLHSFHARDAKALANWLKIRPSNAVTVLDTHDGIGIIDIGSDAENRSKNPGLITDQQLASLVESIHANSQGQSRQATGAAASNLDLYQVNCTFFDALARDPTNYLLARAIQFFVPGVPQVYYVGLLAGENDMKLLKTSGVGRDINRQYFDGATVLQSLKKPVVLTLLNLIRFRNAHDAFNGQFKQVLINANTIQLRWEHGAEWAQLVVDFAQPLNSGLSFSKNGEACWFT